MRIFLFLLLIGALTRATPIHSNGGVGAVACNGHECGPIGIRVLNDGGNAFDAAIAVLLCEGVTGPQNTGIGGGFLSTIYIKDKGVIKSLNAREAAPGNSSEDMFKNLNEIKGGHAAAIPGEIKGYWELKKRYGSKSYSWQQIFQHTIDLCENGYKVDAFLARILKEYKQKILETETLRDIFVDKSTGNVYKEGDIARRPQLAETLKNISRGGADEFYGGLTGQNFLRDVSDMGGVLSVEDLTNYTTIWSAAIKNHLTEDLTLHTVPIPGSGVTLSLILDLVKKRIKDVDEATKIHRIVEDFKHAYGQRSQLADSDYENTVKKTVAKISAKSFKRELLQSISDNETFDDPLLYGGIFEDLDHGTSNIAIIDKHGNAITATSTINNVFGAFVRSPSTGIILNDEMDDFSTPGIRNSYGFEPSRINFIKPGKRPMSSMSPSIVIDSEGDVALLIGASGGSQITSSVALTIIRHIFLNQGIEEALYGNRFHHQLLPMAIQFECYPDNDVLNSIERKGHRVMRLPGILGFNAVTAISVGSGKVSPVCDKYRRGGSALTTNDVA